jgi:drug/metabolite transporter (DMT)-like permease
MLMGIGVLGFKEQITVMNLIGIFLGFWVFYLLTEKPHWGIKREFIKGIPFLLITATCVSLLNAFQKLLPYANVNVFDYLFIASVAGMIFSLWMNWKAIQKGQLLKNSNNIVGMGLLQGFLLGILTVVSGSSYMFWGELVIVYKITSYSIFIPIVLSMIVYKEKITIRKAFAAVLMAISLYFLV